MTDPYREAARDYVRTVLERLGLDATTLARRAGLTPSTLTRFINNPRVTHTLSARSLAKIADYSSVPLPPALGGPPPGPATAARPGPGGGVVHAGAVPAAGGPDLRVLGQARAGQEGLFILNGKVMGYVERPWFLLGRPEAYAVYVNDGSMMPVYRHGELLYVDPSRPPAPADDIIIQLTDGQAFVKRLLRRTAKALTVEQFNPPRRIDYPTERIEAVHLVVAALRVRA